MTEYADRRFVRGCFYAEVDPDKFSRRIAVVETNFSLRVRYIESVLQEVDPKQALNPDQRTTSLVQGIRGARSGCTAPATGRRPPSRRETLTLRLLVAGLKANAVEGYMMYGGIADRLH